MMEVRRVAVARFGTGALPQGEQLADLRRAFVPIWLLDRYQVEAAAKSVGGVDFPYAVNGEPMEARTVAGLGTMGCALRVARYTHSGGIDRPRRDFNRCCRVPLAATTTGRRRSKLFPTASGPVFDPLKATEIGAVQTLALCWPPNGSIVSKLSMR